MPLGLALDVAFTVVAVVFVAGAVSGITGFGFAVVSTATLAGVLSPSDAVVVVILPLFASNLSLATELDRERLASCTRRFWAYVLAAAVGTVAGMVLLDAIPASSLKRSLGVLTLTYAVLTQPFVAVPGKARAEELCFRTSHLAKAGLGVVSGFVFGASNVGVQFVAYLRSLDLDRSTFVGVLAAMLLGISAIRVGLAALLGLYGGGRLFTVSAIAVAPTILGVWAGKLLRPLLSEQRKQALVLVVLLVIGGRLLL